MGVFFILKVKDLMLTNIVTAKKDMTLEKAIEMLHKKYVGSLIIVDENKRCIGIFTERDAIQVLAQKLPISTPLESIMTKDVITVNENVSLDEARAMIKTHRIRHLPVTDENGIVVGLFSVRHVLDEFFGIEHQHEI